MCDLCNSLFHSLGCTYPDAASSKNVCYCSNECQSIVFTQHQSMFNEYGNREIRLQGECLATNKVVYLQRPSSDEAVPAGKVTDKLYALHDYLHVECYQDREGQRRYLIVGKQHTLNESQAWNAVSFICTVLNIPMYLEPLEERVRNRVKVYKDRDNSTWVGALKTAQKESGEYNTFRFIPQFKHDTCDNVKLDDFYVKCICNERISRIFFRQLGCFDFTTGGVCNSYTVHNSRRHCSEEPAVWATELLQVLLSAIGTHGIAQPHNHGLNRRVRRFIR